MIKKKKKLPQYIYFKRSLSFLFSIKIIVILHTLIEFFDIFINSLDITKQLFCFKKKYNFTTENQIIHYLKYISPYYYFYKLLTTNLNFFLSLEEIGAIVYVILFVVFIVLMYTLNDVNLSKITIFSKNLNKLYVNFYDYFFFRTISILFIHFILSNIIKLANSESKSQNLLLIILFSLIALIQTFSYLKYFSTFTVWSNFKTLKENNLFTVYPFDNFFGKKYDILLFFVKILITASKNNLRFADNYINSLQLFLNILEIIVILLFSILIKTYFFISKSKLLFFNLTIENKLRVFLVELCSFSIILRVMYHKNEDYILFLIIFFLILIFLIFLVFFSLDRFVVSNAEKSDSFLGVSWFAQSNDINYSNFMIQWIINHKTTCDDVGCEVCKELCYRSDRGDKNGEEKDGSVVKITNNKVGKVFLSSIFVTKIPDLTQKIASTVVSEDEAKKLVTNISSNTRTVGVNSVAKETYSFLNFNYTLISKAYLEKKNFAEDDLIRLDFLFLTILFISKAKQQFKLYLTLSKLIKKYHSHINALISFLLIFDTIRKSNRERVDDYKLIRKSENLRESLRIYLNDFTKFLHLEMKTPENFIKMADKFQILKDNTKTLHSIFKKNAECNYQLLLLRYLYETVLHSRIKTFHNDLEVNFFEDFLDFHFSNDRLILIKYTIDKKSFTIMKGSRKILQYKQKPLESLFPDYIKEKGLEMFISQLKSNVKGRNIFEFVIKDLNHKDSLGYVEAFKMKYFIYPSNNENEILIQVNYLTDHKHIIIFKVRSSKGEEVLYSLSSKLFRYFGLTPEMIQILSKAGKHIDFNSLFHKPALNLQKGSNICIFQYIRYAKMYKDLMKCEGLNDSTNFETTKKAINEICRLGLEQKEIMFSITEKYSHDNSKSKFIVYELKEYKPIKKTLMNRGSINNYKTKCTELITTTLNQINEIDNINGAVEDDNNSSDDGKDVFVPVFKYEGAATTTTAPTLSVFSTASVSMSTLNSLHSSMSVHGKKSHKESEQKLKYKQVNNFTYLILCFGFFLMLVTLIFLILEIQKNNTFQLLFGLFQSLKYFRRGIEFSPLSILANLCYYSENVDDGMNCYDFYEHYSENIIKVNPIMGNHPRINNIVKEEIGIKFQNIIERFNTFQNEIFKLNFKTINRLGASETEVLSLRNSFENKIIIEKSKITYIELIRSFNNYINMLINQDVYESEEFHLINITVSDDSDSFTIMGDVYDLSLTQKDLYLMVINYPNFHKAILSMSSAIENEFNTCLHQIDIIMVTFFLALLSLHVFLCLISMIFLVLFVQMLKENLIPIIESFSNSSYLEFIENRIAMLKILCEMYEDNPLKIINEITNSEDDYKKAQKDLMQAKKSIEKKQLSGSTPKKKEKHHKLSVKEDAIHGIRMISKKDFDKITLKNKIIILLIFFLYTAYSSIFFVFLTQSFRRLELLVEYSSINSEIDNYICDNVLALEYMRVTNSSSLDLGKLIYGDPSLDYMTKGINSFYSSIESKEYFESMHHSIFPPLSEVIEINFTNNKIEDPFLLQAISSLNDSYNDFYRDLSTCFPVITYGSDNTILKEILYLTNQKFHRYKQEEKYEEMIVRMGNKIDYDLYTMVILVGRLIRTYFNEHVFTEDIHNVFDNFSVMIEVYLILNLFLEIIIFLVLNFIVIARIKVLNRKLLKFIYSLRF